MSLIRKRLTLVTILASAMGCGGSPPAPTVSTPESTVSVPDSSVNPGVNVPPTSPVEKKVDQPNELGFAKVSIRDGDDYQEGIVDAQGKEVVQTSSRILINDITGALALVQFERKFLFVPLNDGFISTDAMAEVNGFQYAEPYQCGFALVQVDDVRFYIDSNGSKAFGTEFEFAESFHNDRALVRSDGRYRIIDTRGTTVANLEFDQVNPQSPWCWQVTQIANKKYTSGFVDLNGKMITEMIYDDVGFYDSEVKRIRVRMNDRHGFLDEHAKVAIPVQYERAEVFNHGKARVVLNGRDFYINPEGMEVPE